MRKKRLVGYAVYVKIWILYNSKKCFKARLKKKIANSITRQHNIAFSFCPDEVIESLKIKKSKLLLSCLYM